MILFLAATKQMYEWFSPSIRPSVCLSVRPSVCHIFHYDEWNFQKWLPMTEVMSMQKVKARGQKGYGQRGQDPI